jgi:hypothetical protein
MYIWWNAVLPVTGSAGFSGSRSGVAAGAQQQ